MDIVNDYVKVIMNTPEYKRLIELNEIIKKKYGMLIVSFKSLEAEYLEVKEYEDFRPEIKEIKEKFVNKKRDLYSKEEVKEYFKLERKINEMLNDDLNELKSAISNKFTLNKILTID